MKDTDNSRSEAPLTYTVEECGRKLNLSRSMAYAACKSGAIPTVRFGRAVRVPRVALERMLEAAGQQED